MARITMLYNGRQLLGIEQANIPDKEKLVTLGMAHDPEASHYEAQIEEQGGDVSLGSLKENSALAESVKQPYS